MDKLKILIVEDEMIIAESVSDMLEDLGYEVMGIAIRAKRALEMIQSNPPDLALFDIRLKGEEDGIWLAGQLKDLPAFPFIFLTSYGDKATIDQAVAASPYGYLLKPVEKQHLYGAIEVALRRFAEKSNAEGESEGIVINDCFFVKDDHQYTKVQISDIDYIKSDDNYLEIFCGNKKHLIRSTMKDFQEQLPKRDFVQTHRSYIVNLKKVEGFSAVQVNVSHHSVPVSKSFKDVLPEYFKMIG